MFGMSSAGGPTLASSPTATPSSPSRTGRLRGLSYLRGHSHSSSPTSQQPASPVAAGQPSSDVQLTRTTSNPITPSSPDSTTPNRRAPFRRDSDFLTSQRSVTEGARRLSASLNDSRLARSPSAASPGTGLRSRSPLSAAPTAVPASATPSDDPNSQSTSAISSSHSNAPKDNQPCIRLIPYQEGRSSRPSLPFPIVTRSVPTASSIIRVGRYSERDNHGAGAGCAVAPVGFKSKVVSRRHCEFWCTGNQWYIKDCKSSSGTFLNHIRLSSPGLESRPYPVNDGDIVQLGIDFKGGEEVIFRCVKIKVECNRGWQKGLNEFNTSTHKRLRDLAKTPASPAASAKDDDTQSVNTSECSICLNPVAPCQALFVAPCSHVWHFKCIRTLILPNWPSFQCPNCRGFSDLDADVEQPELTLDDDGSSSDPDLRQALRDSSLQIDGAGRVPANAEDQDPPRAVHVQATSEHIDDSLLDDVGLLMTATHLVGESQAHDPDSAGRVAPLSDTPSIPIEANRPRSHTQTTSTDVDNPNPLSATPTSTAPFAMADILAYSTAPSGSATGMARSREPSTANPSIINNSHSINNPASAGPNAEAALESTATPRNEAGPFMS